MRSVVRHLFAHGIVRPLSNATRERQKPVPDNRANFRELISVKEHKFGRQ